MKKKDLAERISRLEFRIDMMAGDIGRHEKKIKRLECPHKNIEFVRGGLPVCGMMQCSDCRKILKEYDSDHEFKQDQVEYHRQKADEIETGE